MSTKKETLVVSLAHYSGIANHRAELRVGDACPVCKAGQVVLFEGLWVMCHNPQCSFVERRRNVSDASQSESDASQSER